MGTLSRGGLQCPYLIGDIYITTRSENPSSLWQGTTWEKVGSGRALMGADSIHGVGTTVDSGLPDIQGEWTIKGDSSNAGIDAEGSGSGAIINKQEKGSGSAVGGTNWSCATGFKLKASNYNSIYGASSIVQPPAFFCYFWKRLS